MNPTFATCGGFAGAAVWGVVIVAVVLLSAEIFWWWSRWRRRPDSFSWREALFQFEWNIGSMPVASSYDDEARLGLAWSFLSAGLVVAITGLIVECPAWPLPA